MRTRIVAVAALALALAALPAASASAGQAPTALSYDGATTASYEGNLALAATLLDAATSEPLADRSVAFELEGADGVVVELIELVTGGDGRAASAVRLEGVPLGAYLLRATFPGDETHAPSSAEAEVVVGQAATQVVFTGTSAGVRGTTINLKGLVRHAETGAPIPEQVLRFSIPGQLEVVAVTNASGEATVAFKLDATYGNYPLTLTYAGDERYGGSTLTRTISVNWSWVFTGDQGTGTVRLNDVLDEYRVTSGGMDSGIVAGAEIAQRSPGNLAAVQVVSAHKTGTSDALELIGDTRFGTFQAAGLIGGAPFVAAGGPV